LCISPTTMIKLTEENEEKLRDVVSTFHKKLRDILTKEEVTQCTLVTVYTDNKPTETRLSLERVERGEIKL